MNHNLLKKVAQAREGLNKQAFNAMTDEAQMAAAQQGAAPPPPGMDPAMMGGAPPMDPAMAGGMPPGMDPAMAGGAMPPGMDPMAGGAMPPMDPATGMPMDPAMMGMDPAMMGGAPPMEDPAAGTPITLTLEDLQQVVKEMGGGGGEEGDSKRATNKQIMSELSLVKEQLSAMAAAQGIQLPAGDVGLDGDTSTEPTPGEPEDIDAAATNMAAVFAEEAGAGAGSLEGNPAFDALGAGLPPGEGVPKVASMLNWSETKLG